MDTFAALALATDPPTPSILDRPPEPKSAPLITITMWKMIIGQSIYQLTLTFLLYFGGTAILSYDSEREQLQLPTLIFNTFVFMQIFNQYNNRRLDNKMNIFEGITRNWFFIGIHFIIVGGQVLIVFIGGRAFSVHRLNNAQWIYSIVLGFLSIPVAMVLRLIPDSWIRKCIPIWFVKKAAPKVFVSDDEERQFEWAPALEEIREELAFIKRLRGGRLAALRYKLQHPDLLVPRSRSNSSRSRSRSRSRTNSLPSTPNNELAVNDPQAPPTPDSRKSRHHRIGRSRSNSAFGPAAAMAGVIAGSVAGWSPIGKRDEEGAAASFHNSSDGRSQHEDQELTEAASPGSSSSQHPAAVFPSSQAAEGSHVHTHGEGHSDQDKDKSSTPASPPHSSPPPSAPSMPLLTPPSSSSKG